LWAIVGSPALTSAPGDARSLHALVAASDRHAAGVCRSLRDGVLAASGEVLGALIVHSTVRLKPDTTGATAAARASHSSVMSGCSRTVALDDSSVVSGFSRTVALDDSSVVSGFSRTVALDDSSVVSGFSRTVA